MSRTTARQRAQAKQTTKTAGTETPAAILVPEAVRQHLAQLYGGIQEAQKRFDEAALLVAATLSVDIARYRFDFQAGFVPIEEQQTVDIPLAPPLHSDGAEQDEAEEGEATPG